MTDEPQLAALREEIRRAGALHRAMRWTLLGVAGLVLLSAGVRQLVHEEVRETMEALPVSAFDSGDKKVPALEPKWMFALDRWSSGAGAAGAALLGGAMALFWLWPLTRRRVLRGKLKSLSSTERSRLLASMQEHRSGDARKLATRLLREIRRGGEATPVAAPDARGDEASPAERAG